VVIAPSATRAPRLNVDASRLCIVIGLTLTAIHAAPGLGRVGENAYSVLAVGGIVATVAGTIRNRPRPAGPWFIWAISAVLFAAGAVLRQVYQTTGDLTADRSLLPELFTLPGYLLFAAGFVWLLRVRSRERNEPGVALDATMLALGSFVLVWIFLLNPAIAAQQYAPLSMIAVAIYPPISALLVAIAGRLAFMSGTRNTCHRLLLVGMVTLLIGDALYFLIETHRLTMADGLLDLPYGITYTLLAAAAMHPTMTAMSKPRQVRADIAGLRRGRVTLVAFALVLPALLIVVWNPASRPERLIVALIVLTLTITAIARLIVAMRQQSASEAQYAHLALHDGLTDLPNRHYLIEYVAALAKEGPDDEGISVVYLDLDQFKLVNDSLGHAAGDRLLQAVAVRLAQVVGGDDLLTRLSGDEFLIVVRGPLGAALEVAERVTKALEEPLDIGVELFANASIGVAHVSSPFGAETAPELIRDADTAMYRSKANGRNSITVFDESMRESVARRLSLESDLRTAMAERELDVHFQPIVALPNGEILGFEALVRWSTADGWISPVDFIPVAEESGLIVPLGAWVMAESIRRLAEWRAIPGFGHLTMSVNVSNQQIRGADMLGLVRDALAEADLPGEALWFEVTESMIMADTADTAAVIEGLRSLGVGICVDDFGTGYSSLAYLQKFPIDRIKIDRAFVSTMNDNAKNHRVVAGIAAIAHALEIDAVAEGVEKADQAAALVAVGCDKAQGFLFGRAQPPALITEKLARAGAGAGAGTGHGRDLDVVYDGRIEWGTGVGAVVPDTVPDEFGPLFAPSEPASSERGPSDTAPAGRATNNTSTPP
jgi:diguanylate cyclase (GGDEF)-like protein